MKTTQRRGTRGFDRRHILVDTLGLLVASRAEAANVPDQKAGARLLGRSRALFPTIRTMMADAGHKAGS